MTETSNPNSDKNQHITDYLQHYIHQENVDYAVLLTGPWGRGKTYYIDQFIERIKRDTSAIIQLGSYTLQAIAPISYHHIVQEYLEHKIKKPTLIIIKVSLFGLKSITELESSILLERYALSDNNLTKADKFFIFLSRSAVQLGNTYFLRNAANKLFESFPAMLKSIIFQKQGQQIVLVLDDLERTDIPFKELLGRINAFVERDGIRTILIANEDELTKKTDKDNEEHTLTDAELADAMTSNEEKEVNPLKETSPSIINRMSEDDRKNLEIYTKFKEKVIGKTFKIQNDFDIILEYFLEKSIYKEIISPHLNVIKRVYSTNQFQNLRQLKRALDDFTYLLKHLSEEQRKKQDFIEDLIITFFDLKIDIHNAHSIKSTSSNVYTNDVWTRFLLKNDYTDIKQITSGLHYFIPKPEQPLWMQLQFYYGLEEEFDDLSHQLIENFNNLTEEDYYEYFHIVGLMIYFSKEGLISESIEEIQKTAERYLDKHSPHWVKKYSVEWQNLSLDSSILGNINNQTRSTYYADSDPYFITIWNLFHRKQIEIYNQIQGQTLEATVLESMQETNGKSFDNLPLLASKYQSVFDKIDPEKFFDTLSKVSNLKIFKVNHVIRKHYSHFLYEVILELRFWQKIEDKLKDFLEQSEDLGKIKKRNYTVLLQTIEKTILAIQENKPFFIPYLLQYDQMINLQKYLCSSDQYGQQAILDQETYRNLAPYLKKMGEERINQFSSILTQRYTSLKNVKNVQSELPFWKNLADYLQEDNNEKFTTLILTVEQIIQIIEGKPPQQE